MPKTKQVETKKTVTIDMLEDIHEAQKKKVHDLYVSAGLDPKVDPSDRVYEIFRKVCTKGNVPFDRSVGQVIRTRVKGKEFLIFSCIYSGSDHIGNYATASQDVIGMAYHPKIVTQKQLDDNGETVIVSANVLDLDAVYSIPWNKENFDALRPYFADRLSLVVKDVSRRYSGAYDFDTFANGDFDDLVSIGKFGTIPERQARKAAKDAQKAVEAGE